MAAREELAPHAFLYCARRPCVIENNRNSHTTGALCEAVLPQQARHILARLELHHTPKRRSWLNQAEVAISIVERDGLSCPAGDSATLERRMRALEDERQAQRALSDWRVTNKQARLERKKRYSVVKIQLN